MENLVPNYSGLYKLVITILASAVAYSSYLPASHGNEFLYVPNHPKGVK